MMVFDLHPTRKGRSFPGEVYVEYVAPGAWPSAEERNGYSLVTAECRSIRSAILLLARAGEEFEQMMIVREVNIDIGLIIDGIATREHAAARSGHTGVEFGEVVEVDIPVAVHLAIDRPARDGDV